MRRHKFRHNLHLMEAKLAQIMQICKNSRCLVARCCAEMDGRRKGNTGSTAPHPLLRGTFPRGGKALGVGDADPYNTVEYGRCRSVPRRSMIPLHTKKRPRGVGRGDMGTYYFFFLFLRLRTTNRITSSSAAAAPPMAAYSGTLLAGTFTAAKAVVPAGAVQVR